MADAGGSEQRLHVVLGMSRSEETLSPASEGRGPLLQRDYWGLVESPRVRASEVGGILAAQMMELAPPGYVRFRRTHGTGPLEVGDELDVKIRFAGTFRVRVTHQDDHSITFATVHGHPEAGRITFGAYRTHEGHLVIHVRSRARSASLLQRIGFLLVGESLQTSNWGELVKTIAATVGEGVAGPVYEETQTLDGSEGYEELFHPTFVAQGD